jgi:hypothetical protein
LAEVNLQLNSQSSTGLLASFPKRRRRRRRRRTRFWTCESFCKFRAW